MIPIAYLREWSVHAPWSDMRQVEQDLIICRALCDLFNSNDLKGKIAFRGGTAIHKLLFGEPLRYSEDIDLVQIQSEPIGNTVDSIRTALSWLGPCRRAPATHSMHLRFRFQPEGAAGTTLNLKVEINTREHQPLYGIKDYPYEIRNSWHTATTTIASYEPEELFGTKLRALLQRRKNRDLFDLAVGMKQLGLDRDKLIACFEHYLTIQGAKIERADAEQTMLKKLSHSLTEDIAPLLPPRVVFSEDDAIEAFGSIWTQLIARITGDPWAGSNSVIEEIRKKTLPNLLVSDTPETQ